MATKKQRADAAKKKEKRTKIFAIVGCVLLVAIGAYEIPSMLAVMNKKPPPSTYDPGPSTVPGGLPNVAAGAGATPATGQLASAGAPAASAGQLVSFDVFEAKNPFAPQVSAAADSSSAPTTAADRPAADATSRATPTAASTPTTPATVPATGAATPGQSVTQTPPTSTTPSSTTPAAATGAPTATTTTTAPAQPTVALKVNDAVSHVASGGTFPSDAPVFRLVTWTKTTAQIAIVGGSYATGDQTLTLKIGEPVTLENQTSGKRYTIELLSTG